MSLRSILKDEEPLSMSRKFNLYYIHWFSIVHFFIEGSNKDKFIEYFQKGCEFKDFEKLFGSIEDVEKKWYSHLLKLTKKKK